MAASGSLYGVTIQAKHSLSTQRGGLILKPFFISSQRNLQQLLYAGQAFIFSLCNIKVLEKHRENIWIMDYSFQPEVTQKFGGILLNVTSSKQNITFQHSQKWKCSAENVNMLVTYECKKRKWYCFAIKVQNNHWNVSKQTLNLPVTYNSKHFLFTLLLEIKKKQIFLLNSFSFRKIPKCFIGSYTAIKQSHRAKPASQVHRLHMPIFLKA